MEPRSSLAHESSRDFGEPTPDLVLTDVVMPGLSAKALSEEVFRVQPRLPVLYMSGYPGEDVVRRGLLNAEAPFLQKPFSLEDLAWRIRALLDQARRESSA